MSATQRLASKIETLSLEGLSILNRAESRGHLTVAEMQRLDTLECSELPIMQAAYKFAAERDGKRAVTTLCPGSPDPRKRKGLHIRNAAKGERGAVFVYGEIGDSYSGITADDFRSALAAFDPHEDVDLHVHSPGGSFGEAVAISSQISNRPGAVFGFVDGSAYSGGSVILQSCETITMAPASKQMIHYASLTAEGSYGQADLERALDAVAETNRQLVEVYSKRWKGTKAELQKALERETYYGPHEAIRVGLADYVSDTVKIASYADTTPYRDGAKFSIAAHPGPHKQFNIRRASFQLWRMAADEMRSD